MGKSVQNKIKKLPDGPGVYFFIAKKKILYIGKATSLRDRVRSYMSRSVLDTRGPIIEKMLERFDDIKFQKTDSVLEALILEANLIKKHQPPANTIDKDDKSFNYVVITKENFPRVLVMRGREIEKLSGKNNSPPLAALGPSLNLREGKGRVRTFGPFPNGLQLKEAMKIVRKMFPFRDKCNPRESKPCFNRQISLCPGVCTGEISKGEYAKQIKNIILFFKGKKKLLIKKLEKEMKAFSNSREYENAGKIKRQIFALNHIQDIALIKNQVSKVPFDTRFRVEAYDVAHLSGTNMVGVMVVIENSEVKKSDYRKFKIKEKRGGDVGVLSEILIRRLAHKEWPLPNLIVVDGSVAQKNIAEKVLKENNMQIPVVAVVKDNKHKPREIIGINYELKITSYDKKELEKQILLANSEAHRFAVNFHKHLRNKLV